MPSIQTKRFDELRPDGIDEVTGIGLEAKQRLWKQTVCECEAMAQLALNTGRTIPVEIVERLDQALSAPGALGAAARRGSSKRAMSLPRAAEISPLASLSMAHAALA